MNFPTIKSRNTAKRVARFGWPTPIVWGPLSSGARNAALPPEHRCSIRLASVLPVGRMGAVFLNANGSKRPGNGVALPFFVPRPIATRNREKRIPCLQLPTPGPFFMPVIHTTAADAAQFGRMRRGRAEGKEYRAVGKSAERGGKAKAAG